MINTKLVLIVISIMNTVIENIELLISFLFFIKYILKTFSNIICQLYILFSKYSFYRTHYHI